MDCRPQIRVICYDELMKQELKHHLFPLVVIFTITSLIWIVGHVLYYQFIYLFFGLAWGSFALDTDHLIYWLYLKPTLPESRQARQYLQQKNLSALLKLLEKTHKKHTSLIFHHYFFQITLALVSLFIITSSGSVFASSLVLALNLHLLVDELHDYRHQPRHLQIWLFARESKQLPIKYLKHYLATFTLFSLFFLIILIKSAL